jgi:hypothetical protein
MTHDEDWCHERISQPPHYLHTHACNRPVKATYRAKGGSELHRVCGVHARVYARLTSTYERIIDGATA